MLMPKEHLEHLELGFIINEIYQILPNFSYHVMKGVYWVLDLEATCQDVYPAEMARSYF